MYFQDSLGFAFVNSVCVFNLSNTFPLYSGPLSINDGASRNDASQGEKISVPAVKFHNLEKLVPNLNYAVKLFSRLLWVVVILGTSLIDMVI